jgi:hypothetical protein
VKRGSGGTVVNRRVLNPCKDGSDSESSHQINLTTLALQENFAESSDNGEVNLDDINMFVDQWEKVDVMAAKVM